MDGKCSPLVVAVTPGDTEGDAMTTSLTLEEMLKLPIPQRLTIAKGLLASVAHEEGYPLYARGHIREMLVTLGGLISLMEWHSA